MTRQILSRLLLAVPMLIAVTFGTFVLLFAIGDPAAAMAGDGASEAQIQEIRERHGFDRPIVVQYFAWLGSFLQGDLGDSMQNRGSVVGLMSEYLPPTLLLSVLAMVIAVVVAIIVGSLAGLRPGGVLDRSMQGITLLGIAIPNFLVGMLLILAFAIWIPAFPAGGYRTPEQVGLLGSLEYLFLPAVALALSLMCIQARTFRSAIIEEYAADYVRTARMKGASVWQIFFRHVGRNASAPLVAVIGLEVGVLITGALLVEVVFAVPGVGTLTIESVRGQDFPVVQSLVALFGAVVLAANLVADLVAFALNPAARSAS